VEPIKEAELAKQFGGGGSSAWSGGSSAYMLLYRQKPAGAGAPDAGAPVPGTAALASRTLPRATEAAPPPQPRGREIDRMLELGLVPHTAPGKEQGPGVPADSTAMAGDFMGQELKRHCSGHATPHCASAHAAAEATGMADGDVCQMDTEDSVNPYSAMGF
jgi:hypothetical protein